MSRAFRRMRRWRIQKRVRERKRAKSMEHSEHPAKIRRRIEELRKSSVHASVLALWFAVMTAFSILSGDFLFAALDFALGGIAILISLQEDKKAAQLQKQLDDFK